MNRSGLTNRSRFRTAVAALAVGALLLLTGCVRFQVDLRIEPGDTVDGTIVVAVLADDTEQGREQALEATGNIEEQLLGAVVDHPSVRAEDYAEDGYIGVRYVLRGTPIDQFDAASGDALRIVRDGDEFVVSGALDFTGEATPPGDGEDLDDTDLTVSITFPGEVLSHNGTLDGRTVRWSTPITERLEYEARGVAAAAGPPIGLVVGIAVAALLVIAAIVVVLVLVLRRRPQTPTVAPAPPAVDGEPPAAAPPPPPPRA